MGQVIRVGAEAVVVKTVWNGFSAVCKHRTPKPYRLPELDRRIREQRTLHEVKVMLALKRAGVPCPAVFLVDRSDAAIYMQYIEGVELRTWLEGAPDGEMERVATQLGRVVGKMHNSMIAHGDLTTSNVIVDNAGRLYLVDFGLSVFTSDLEDLAVDIHLLDRSLESAHYSHRPSFMQYFLRGYSEVLGRDFTRNVLNKVKEIRMRGRYVEERRR